MKFKQITVQLLVALLIMSMLFSLTACKEKDDNTAVSKETTKEESKSDTKDIVKSEESILVGETLTIWKPLLWVGKVSSAEENIVWQTIQSKFDLEIEFIQPSSGEVAQQFNLMIAGDALPDIISTDWGGDSLYTGGIDKYVQDMVLLPVNDLVEEYAPDYINSIRTLVPKDEQMAFYTDSGNLVQFYAISPYEEYCYNGILYRQDWMDELGLKNPKTLEDVEKTLTAFKDDMGATSPMIFPSNGLDNLGGAFVSAYDIGPGFYHIDGVVKYGPLQNEFKQYLALMNSWYEKGLIDQDFVARDGDTHKRMITTGESGAIIHSPDTVSAWMTDITPMMGGYNPVQTAGDEIKFRLKTFRARPPYAMAVTTECEKPEVAVSLLNFGYTEDGYMLYNYGTEGETYNVVDGKVVYTDMMLNNPDWPVLDAILKFKVHIGPFLRFEHEGNPAINASTSEIRQFFTESSGTQYVLPPVTLTADEGTEYARIMTQLTTYKDTAVLEFILGARSLDEFDAFVADLEKLEIDTAISMQQAALDRYDSRLN